MRGVGLLSALVVSLVPQPWLQTSGIISSALLDLSSALQQKGPRSAPVYLAHTIPEMLQRLWPYAWHSWMSCSQSRIRLINGFFAVSTERMPGSGPKDHTVMEEGHVSLLSHF